MQSLPLHFMNADNQVDTQSLFSEVLLVESDPKSCALLEQALLPSIGELVFATTAEEALLIIETQFIELIIIAVDIEGISGISLLHSIEHLRPGLPVIATAPSACLEDALAAMREGAWDYIIKSDPPTLADRTREAIQHVANRKLTEMRDSELRSERLSFWGAVQMAQDGLAIIGPTGLVTFANSAFQDFAFFLGARPSPDEPLNLLSCLAIHEEPLAHQLALVLRGQRSGDTIWSSELKADAQETLVGPTTRYFQLNLSSINVGGFEGGGLVDNRRHVLWVSDITQRKEHEKFQREVLSTTSHDLKGPLGTITCAAELIAESDDALSADSTEMIKRIYSCARKALNHIDEFLSARKIEDGVLQIDPAWFSLDEFLDDLVLDYSMMAKARGLHLSFEPAAKDLEIFADKLSLSRVIGNLLANAIKFTPADGKIVLRTERSGQNTKISISDTGPGIDPQVRHTLFERYTRLKQHGQIEGTGLGLYIAKNIIEAHQGRIEVESELGKGTTFHLYLPDELAQAHAVESETASAD